MRFIALDDKICIVTWMKAKQETDTTTKTYGSQSTSRTAVTGTQINGSMYLFSDTLPDLYEEDGCAKTMTLQFKLNDAYLVVNKAIFLKKRQLPGYENEAFYVEWTAPGISVHKKEEVLSTQSPIM